jgi:large subunit ribosomal protein L18
MAIKNRKEFRRFRIKKRIRKVIQGTPDRPRMTVFRSNKDIYVQLVDDLGSKTLVSASSQASDIASQKVTKKEKAKLVGKLIAEKAKEAGVEAVVFDRNGYLYHGRVKSLAEAARENGLKF